MANYYKLRVLRPDGSHYDAAIIFKLSPALKWLNGVTGIQWPYQVIHRIVKGGCWAEAFTMPGVGSLLAVVEDVGNGYSPHHQLGRSAVPAPSGPAGYVTEPLLMLAWTDDDWARYSATGEKPMRLVHAEIADSTV